MPSSSTEQAGIDAKDIQRFVADWYEVLDRHLPFDKVREYLVDDGIRFVFPEVTVTSHEELRGWYDTVTSRFFDEVHEVEVADVEFADRVAKVHVIVKWATRIWTAPEPDSHLLEFRADQNWEVDLQGGRPRLRTYVVTSFVPLGDTPELF